MIKGITPRKAIFADQDILIRPVKKSDLEELYKIALENKSEIHEMQADWIESDFKDFSQERRIRKKRERETPLVIIKENKIVGEIGFHSFHSWEDKDQVEVAYWIDKNYQGKGITKKALKALIDFGFQKLKLDTIRGKAYSHNIPSCKVMEGCGMKQIGDSSVLNTYKLDRDEYLASAA